MLKNYIIIIWFPLTVFLCFCLFSLVQTYPLANDFPQTKGRQRSQGARTMGSCSVSPADVPGKGVSVHPGCPGWLKRLVDPAVQTGWKAVLLTFFYFWGERRGEKF